MTFQWWVMQCPKCGEWSCQGKKTSTDWKKVKLSCKYCNRHSKVMKQEEWGLRKKGPYDNATIARRVCADLKELRQDL